jgi:hypothetical protein
MRWAPTRTRRRAERRALTGHRGRRHRLDLRACGAPGDLLGEQLLIIRASDSTRAGQVATKLPSLVIGEAADSSEIPCDD